MNVFLTLLSDMPMINWPDNPVSWVTLIMGFCLIAYLTYILRALNKPWGKNRLIIFLILLLVTPMVNLFIGGKITLGQQLPPPGAILDTGGEAVMIFSAVPWFLVGGLLGPLPATILGLASGLIGALWDTHDPFTILQIGFLALLVSVAISQRFRTEFYRLLRRPLPAAFFAIFLYPLIYLVFAPFSGHGWIALRLDYVFSNLFASWAAASIELIMAGVFAQVIVSYKPDAWGGQAPYLPSPAEKSLHARFFLSIIPVLLLLLISLVIGLWVITFHTTEKMLKAEMAASASAASENVPYFLNSGLDIIQHSAMDRRLNRGTLADRIQALDDLIKSHPYFSEFILLDDKGELVTVFPVQTESGQLLTSGDQANIQLALSNLPSEYYIVPPGENDRSAQISFAAPIENDVGSVVGVLLARTNLEENPLAASTLSMLNSLTGLDGVGMLLDENGRIIVHTTPSQVLTDFGDANLFEKVSDGSSYAVFGGKSALQAGIERSNYEFVDKPYYGDLITADGTRNLVYIQPAYGSHWTVVFAVPVETITRFALSAAAPLLALTFVLLVLVGVILWFGLNAVTNSLNKMTAQTNNLTEGILVAENYTKLNLDSFPLEAGEDEIGQLRNAYQKMFLNIKNRLEDLGRLLRTSFGVASSLELDDAVQTILGSALTIGASTARIVLPSSLLPELPTAASHTICYSVGSPQDAYEDLDEQILAISRTQDSISLTELKDSKALRLPPDNRIPPALFAASMRHEDQWYGALWVAFDQPHTFSAEEVQYLSSLAEQAAIAAANARVFLNAEIGRQWLAAILDSSPDPILVTDRNNRLILVNPAASQLFNLRAELDKSSAGTIMLEEGLPIEQVIKQKELINLLRAPFLPNQSIEIGFKQGAVYLAAVSAILVEAQPVGRICMLRNVTRFKELDTLKTEFVSTVSHDLRTPLSLVRGYATMLEMVGPLNEQQTGYMRKMVSSVENMSRLVNNLLDLGRIEAGVGLQLEMVPACEIAERVVSSLKIHANQKKIHMTTDCQSPGGWVVEADAALLHQALHNLVENAIRFNHNEGSVSVKVYPHQENIIFEVRDTGIGISPMDQGHLFDKFHRNPDHSARGLDGTGLGLAIVHSIVERHSGTVSVQSKLGEGSTFYLSLPVRQDKR